MLRTTRGVIRLGCLAGLPVGCADTGANPNPDVTVLVLSTIARAEDGVHGLFYSCSLVARAQFATPLDAVAVGRTTVDYERSVAAGDATQVRRIGIPQDIKVDRSDHDRVRVILGQPRPDTLVGRREGDGVYRGQWDCGPGFPFANDAAMVDLGQDSSGVIEGNWIIQEPRDAR